MLSIKIPRSSMNNDAFREDKRLEVIRILKVVLDQLEWGMHGAKLIDINGNIVGEWKLT